MARFTKYKAVASRINDSVKQARKLAELAAAREMNEAQTTDVVEDILEKMLGYDRFADRFPQFNIDDKGKNIVDILLQFGDGIRVPVEIKQATLRLNDRHAGQLEDYAKLLGSEFGILTNGIEWQLHSYDGQAGDIIISRCNMLADAPKEISEAMYVFAKEAIRGGHTSKQAELAAYLQAGNVADALVSKRVLSAIRLEMKDRHGVRLDDADIRNVLMGEVVRSNLLSPGK